MTAQDGSAVICPRVSDGAEKELVNSGWLHRLNGNRTPSHKGNNVSRQGDVEQVDWRSRNNTFQAALTDERLQQCAYTLGVGRGSLRQLRAGFCTAMPALTFPMFDAAGQIIGIRLRTGDARKLAIRGSHAGVFLPRAFSHKPPLMICEGPTDAAALYSLSFDVIGRPSCRGGTDIIVKLLDKQEFNRPHVVIVADRDGPGMEGATALAERIGWNTKSVAIITPPAKDARAWTRGGATAADVTNYIKGAGAGGRQIVSNDTAPARF